VELERRVGPVVTCREVRQDGRTVGELEASVFAAALIIDRDGILADKARGVMARAADVASAPTFDVVLPGAAGCRADAVQRTSLPYVYVSALAARDSVDGGVLVTIRSLSPDWPAAEHMLRSLRVLTRQGKLAEGYEHGVNDNAPLFPLVVANRR